MKIMKFAFVFLALSISSLFTEQANGFRIVKQVQVAVANKLSNNKILLVHCKSKDDDLGVRNVQINQNFSWIFTPNFWGTTLFWCYVAPDNNSHASFKSYHDDGKYLNYCKMGSPINCQWVAKDDGIYLTNFANKSYDMFRFKWEAGRSVFDRYKIE